MHCSSKALSHQLPLSPAQVVVPTRVGQVYVYDSPKGEQDEYDVPRHLQEIYDVPPTRGLLSNQGSQEVSALPSLMEQMGAYMLQASPGHSLS